MLLHKNRELFKAVVQATANEMSLPIAIVEKDYYVTMILKLLADKAPECVFKGGTSLSKCHHVIDRFSEDIDISFSNQLTQGQRRKLKNEIIASISAELEMPIIDWENTHSRRDYNCYTFRYEPIEGYVPQSLIEGVKMEVVLGSLSFPTIELQVDSFIYKALIKDNEDIVKEYELEPFSMKLQSLERTFVDKVFAICDYYLKDEYNKHSRHIYDLYMLFPKLVFDNKFKNLVAEVRKERTKMTMCPSAKPEIYIPKLLKEIVDKKVYFKDYIAITSYFQNKPVPYDEIIKVINAIIKSKMFG